MLFKKEKSESGLEKYISEDFSVNQSVSKPATAEKFTKQAYYYLALYLDEPQPENIPSLTADCVKTLLANEGVVQVLFSTFIFVSFEAKNPKTSISEVNKSLLSKFPNTIRIVYGETNTFCANLGYGSVLRYCPVIPRLDKILELLTSAERGKATLHDFSG